MSYYAKNPWTECRSPFATEPNPDELQKRRADVMALASPRSRVLEVALVTGDGREHAYFSGTDARRDLEKWTALGSDERGRLRPLRHTGHLGTDALSSCDYWQAVGAQKVLGLMDMHAAATVGDLMDRLGLETVVIDLDALAEAAE